MHYNDREHITLHVEVRLWFQLLLNSYITQNLCHWEKYPPMKHSSASLFISDVVNFSRDAWMGDWKINRKIDSVSV